MITFFVILVYIVTAVILFTGKKPNDKLTITEKLFVPALVLFNVTMLLFALIVFIIGLVYKVVTAAFKR